MAPSRTQQLANRQFGYLKVLRRTGHKACNVNGHRWTDWIEQTGRKRHVPR